MLNETFDILQLKTDSVAYHLRWSGSLLKVKFFTRNRILIMCAYQVDVLNNLHDVYGMHK